MSYKKIVAQKIKEFQIQEFIRDNLKQVGLSSSKLQMTPLGEKVVVNAARPGLIVGRKGQSIKKLTNQLKKKFNLENPQIEINELDNPNLDANIIAERVATSLERFGSARFKGIGHKVLEDVMNAGALGIELVVSGKVPSARAKRWRFYQGYLKKSGDVAISGVKTAYAAAQLKSGTIGIQVRIMPPIELPDKVKMRTEESIQESEATAQAKATEEKAKKPRKKTPKKHAEVKKHSEPKKEVKTEEKTEKAVEEKTEDF
ncbi:30S ribosomal protein S3 [Candidatus Woesearchaeota archaeon]|nr:30S ribosomal protein S3 [Candidatus Woesearchaeota archaeon]